MGRGTEIHKTQSLFGVPIEPEKEIILTVVEVAQTDVIFSAIEKAAKLHDPGMGIAFVLNIDKIAGRHQMTCQQTERRKFWMKISDFLITYPAILLLIYAMSCPCNR